MRSCSFGVSTDTLLMALVVAVLCVSFSQTLAAAQTAAKLKETFVTVALPTSMNAEAEDWVERFASENPDIILEDLHHGLASAYIPALTQDNLTDHLYEAVHMNDNYTKEPEYPVYSGAMLEITLTEIGAEGSAASRYRPTTDGTGLTATLMPYGDGYGVCLEGTVDRVLGLQEGYHDPTDYSLKLYPHVVNEQEYLNMGLTVGERYLVYSEEYLDLDWLQRSNLDTTNTANIVSILRSLAHEEGYTVIIVTHDTAVAEQADVVLQMKDGAWVE